jgi:hypothetical protein
MRNFGGVVGVLLALSITLLARAASRRRAENDFALITPEPC